MCSLQNVTRFLEDRVLMVRERAAGLYSTAAYLIAVTLVELPILLLARLAINFCTLTIVKDPHELQLLRTSRRHQLLILLLKNARKLIA